MINYKSSEEEIVESIKTPLIDLIFQFKNEEKVEKYIKLAWEETKEIYYQIQKEVTIKKDNQF